MGVEGVEPVAPKPGMFAKLDAAVEKSIVGKYFAVTARKTTFSTEMRAGVVTFLTACYILAVNSAILADTGGPCTINDCTNPKPGCQFADDPGYEACVVATRKSLVTATAATAAMATFLMGSIANLPFAIMPGMGVNAYFAYTVVGFRGTGMITYQEALAAVFIEGWIFVLLSVSGLRSGLLSLVPRATMLATAGGIGLFLAFIGLQKSEGLGVVVADPAVLVTLGGCPHANQVHMYAIADPSPAAVCSVDPKTGALAANLGPAGANYMCKGGKMKSPTMWLGVAGFTVIVVLMSRRVNGAIMLGILFTTFISWIPGHGASYLGSDTDIPGGEDRLETFRHVVSVPNAAKTSLTWSFGAFTNSHLWVALVTFLYLDFLDATGTMYSMASTIDKELPGFINQKDKSFPRSIFAFTLDGIGIVIGSLLGCAPLTVCLESAAGIREGGRTGLTALSTAFCFFISLFFTPLIVSIPPYATGGALIIVGALMMENIVDIDWSDIGQAVPAFLTIAIMPLTYSVAYGVIAGLCASIVISLINLTLDVSGALVSRKPVKDAVLPYVPGIILGRFANVRPLKSASGILQEHVDPEHERHYEEVSKRAYSEGRPDAKIYESDKNNADLPK
ncbi:putative MFS transporter, AGZA family, xanthine/uracil permease [Monoraphidium neglectum]|uniref:Putative MFS transporter, AGZA family, xanthine/uracil permease n=1 Tax=Monoraphidium neglectum TaxID=145388 RepID=A0A0D2NKK5_9CHLO|nr:putative MFS transporter, AGZA family, xanthine/uracil permease [Monoraphidium neglectum]KIZ05321.1 putative MFS transporter, AGZA family, xanthine/uracil permease [Monoraphidium neglectum]|eukprot:XP_013904340.1 putative MFS transporter, AGZA family, xanthine/uracil permease [Monoraphidium neglectum]